MSDVDIADRADALAEVETWVCGTDVAPSAAADARGRLAAALGLQASGQRATAFLVGDELIRSIDLLAQAARRRLPLVVHLATDGDHLAYHAAATTGAALLFAASAREAVDLTLIARRVAEDALVPVLVAADAGCSRPADPELVPEPEIMRRFLGAAGEAIHPPTPGQEMLFGKHRRRTPRWHDAERPLLTGSVRGEEAAGPAAAAGRTCFDAHLPALLEQAFEAFAGETGRRYEALRGHRLRGSRILLVAQGAAVETAVAVADRLRAERGPKVGVAGLRALRPLPADALAEAVRGRKAIAVLENLDPAGAEPPLAAELRSALGAADLPPSVRVIYGLGSAPLRKADLEALCRELADKRTERRPIVYLGLGGGSATEYPKLRAHLDALHRAYPEIARLGLRAPSDAAAVADADDGGETGARTPRAEPPAAVRRMGPAGAPLGDLAAFGDRVGVLYRDRDPVLAPDPFLASGTVPPMTAALTAPPPARELLPAFEPALCTGCGNCWSACPDGAVAPLAIGPRSLLDEGMRLAQRRGHSVDKLRMVASKLAKRVADTLTADGGVLGEVLDGAFVPLIDKMKLPDERKAAVREAYDAVRGQLAELPVARTAPFFDSGGELFTLAIDPDACQGCGLCVAECEPRALTAATDSPERTAAARGLWRLQEELPQPAQEVLERAGGHPEVGPLAGALLARQAREVMTAAASEPGSGEALAARQALGAMAAHRLPILERQRAEIEELRSKLAAAIHDELSQALPDRDLEALARGLDALDQPDAELADLTERVETAFETERVDVPGTRRLVEAGRELADLAWRLEKGEGGLGRAPFGVVLAGSPAAWGGTFPRNPFAVPVAVAPAGDAAAMARGLIEGYRRRTLDDARALRRARAELERAGGRRSREDDEDLDWRTLDDDERRRCPPLVLLASEDELSGAALGSALAALDTDLPLKLIAFSDPSGAAAGVEAGAADPAVFACSAGGVYLVQTSIAEADHLGRVLTAALVHDGPAFVRILAPGPARGGFAADATLQRAREVVADDGFELWSSGPGERVGRRDLLAALQAPPVAQAAAEETPADPVPDADAVAARIAEIEQRHAAETAALRAHYDAYIAQLRAGLKTEMARQVHGKLMQLVAGARDGQAERPEVEE